jgi:hypothetical protein
MIVIRNTHTKEKVSSTISIYNELTMKAKYILGSTTILLGILTLFLVLTNFAPPAAFAKDTGSNLIMLQQATLAPQIGETSEIGSTEGILVMGVVIVLIVTVPLFFHKRK